MLFAGLGQPILGKNCALVLDHGVRPVASGCTEDLRLRPGDNIIYIFEVH